MTNLLLCLLSNRLSILGGKVMVKRGFGDHL